MSFNAIIALFPNGMKSVRGDEKHCLHFKDKSRIIELPFIAMIEQYLVNGKFADNIYLQKFNGRYATVYIDKNKWGTPLIDICGKNSYNTEEAEKRIKELNQIANQKLHDKD